MLLNSGVHKQCLAEAHFSFIAVFARLKPFKPHASGFQPVLNNQKSNWPSVKRRKRDRFTLSYLPYPLATVIDTAIDYVHFRPEPVPIDSFCDLCLTILFSFDYDVNCICLLMIFLSQQLLLLVKSSISFPRAFWVWGKKSR